MAQGTTDFRELDERFVHENVPVDFVRRIFKTMNEASWHKFQVLTKRPRAGTGTLKRSSVGLPTSGSARVSKTRCTCIAFTRFEKIEQAAIKFLSIEPLLGRIKKLPLTDIDWVIVGGESGPGARPMAEEWVTEIRDQCVECEVPFFFKQWGGVRKCETGRRLERKLWNGMPEEVDGCIGHRAFLMGHEADSSFFESKRPWSERKDLILGYYLKPYLPKVAQLRKPILIVDGFAGPGKFGDGKSGSPVIICDAISTRPPSMATARIKAIFIEKNQALHSRLSVNVQDRVFAQTRCMSFLDVIDEIYREAQSSTTFLYLRSIHRAGPAVGSIATGVWFTDAGRKRGGTSELERRQFLSAWASGVGQALTRALR